MQIEHMALVLADISGYTRFIRFHSMSLLHAEQIITELLEAVIDAADYPLTLAKLEGDAVLLYAKSDGNHAAVCRSVLDQVYKLFQSFQERRDYLADQPICPCDACVHMDDLRLKVVLHFGEVAVKQIRQFQELAGEPVIATYRLMKNSVPARQYLLLTDTFYQLSGGLPGREAEARSEELEGLGSIAVQVYYLEAASQAVAAPVLSIAMLIPPSASSSAPALHPARKSLWERWWQHLRHNRHLLGRIFGRQPKTAYYHLDVGSKER